MARQKTISESIAEIKKKYSKRMIGFIEFYDGDDEGKAFAYNLHRLLLQEEGYAVSLSKMQLGSGSDSSSTTPGRVEIGHLDSGIRNFQAFHVRIYPDIETKLNTVLHEERQHLVL